MKTCFAVLLLTTVCVIAGPQLISPPPNGHINLAWEYDTNLLSTNLFFNVYETTNLTIPIENWNCLTNIVGTNLSVQLTVQPGEHFFVMTASNFWGETSCTSQPAYTPPLPIPMSNTVRIEKAP